MRKAIALLAALAVIGGMAFAAPAKKYRIFMDPKFTGLSYFEICADGARDAAKELGVDFTYTGSEQADVPLQVQSLENILSQKPDAIIVSAIDFNAVAPPLVKAREMGIKVVSYDADTATNARAILDCALLDSPKGGEIAFIAASPTSPNLMQAYPNLKVIISSSAVSAPGVALPSSIKSYLKDGSQKAFFIWDPALLGYMSVYVAKAALDGTLKNTVGSKVKCGKLGEFTVAKDGEIVYGRPLIFTADNIDKYDF